MAALNCRPGDTARIVAPGPYYGRLVDILEAAPVGVYFKLPDGNTQVPCGAGEWVIELLGSPIPVRLESGRHRLTHVGVAPDTALRPIRNPGDDAVDEMVAKLGPAPMTLTEIREWSEVNHD